ncbi:hypothetical protein ACP70R_046493 [Stipagrostis hirtigluma subsp. patula]
MAMASEQDSRPTEERCPDQPPAAVPMIRLTDSPEGLGPYEGCRCRPPSSRQHRLPDLGRQRRPPPAAAAADAITTTSSQLHLRGPRPLAVGAVVATKKDLVAGTNGTGVGLTSGRSQAPPPASRSCAAAAVAKSQRPPFSGKSDFFEEFHYIPPSAGRKAQGQATATCNVQLQQQGEQAGTCCRRHIGSHCSATPVSCPSGVFCHACCCVHPISATAVERNEKKKMELSSQVLTPFCCAGSDTLPSPFSKLRYTHLEKEKDQNQSGCATPQLWRPLAHCPVGGSKVRRKRVQAASQEGRRQTCADKRRKTMTVSATQKPKNKKSASQQKPRMTSSAVLTAAEKRLDMYRRLPPDQLVAPRRHTPYNLLQERYAPDPWKVTVICMLLNRTRGKPIKELVEGFFARYPDAQTACDADLEGMVEYLRPTGLQLEKAVRIRKFSSSYLSSDWTYVTELHGVGKYAADAYAIFCAGRVMEVQPEDHKLVDYWKYVCNIGEPWEEDDSCFAI